MMHVMDVSSSMIQIDSDINTHDLLLLRAITSTLAFA